MKKSLKKKETQALKPRKQSLFHDLAFWVTVCTDAVHLIRAAAVMIRHLRVMLQEKKEVAK